MNQEELKVGKQIGPAIVYQRPEKFLQSKNLGECHKTRTNMLNRLWKIPNHKHQITNKFKYLNSKSNPLAVCFGHLEFDIGYCLVFVIWSLEIKSTGY